MPKELLRFPRTSLIADAGAFESRIQFLMDATFSKMQEASDLGITISERKLEQRFNQLELCRSAANALRQACWDLE